MRGNSCAIHTRIRPPLGSIRSVAWVDPRLRNDDVAVDARTSSEGSGAPRHAKLKFVMKGLRAHPHFFKTSHLSENAGRWDVWSVKTPAIY